LDAEEEPFFYNPYCKALFVSPSVPLVLTQSCTLTAGELSLDFPKASKKLRGGILADGERLSLFASCEDLCLIRSHFALQKWDWARPSWSHRFCTPTGQ
jgi:hypothetical protein